MLIKKGLFYTSICIAVTVIILTVTEILVRIIVPKITTVGTSESIVADSLYYNTYGLKPNSNGTSHGETVTVDKYGFRGSKTAIDTTKPSLLVLGDSVTFGIGIEDDYVFSAILNSKLNNINVINPSAIGYNKTCYKNVYKSLIKEYNNKFNINRVLLIWCLNDVYANTSVLNAPGNKIRTLFPRIFTFIRIHSKSYHFVKSLILDRPKAYFEYDKQYYSLGNVDFQNSIEIIDELKQFSTKNAIIFEILLLPYEYQFRSDDFTPQELIENALHQSVTVYDIANYLKESDYRIKEYYLYGDGIHFSKLGHKLISDYILKYIY